MARLDTDVAIIGCGPVGATLACLLGQRGVRTLVLERADDILNQPRAVSFDGEVMRVYQSMGVAEELLKQMRLSDGHIYYDEDGQVIMTRAAARAVGPQGWGDYYLFHQPHLERTLRDRMAALPGVDLRSGAEVTEIRPEGDSVTLVLANGDTVSARYVVGCDGARSITRAHIGGELEDLGMHQPWAVADFVLKRPRPDLPARTVQFCHPVRPHTYVNVVGNRRRWEFMMLPDDDPAQMTSPEKLWSLVSDMITPDDAVMERAAVYTFHSLIATRWQRDRVLIAGDSAHQTPPFLGQGMCAGVRDVANLAWKLAFVLEGRATPALLDTYGPERIPHVRAFLKLAVEQARIIQAQTEAEVAERRARFAAGSEGELVVPSPPLGAGFHTGTGGGLLTPQFHTDDGRLTDDTIGDGLAILATSAALAAIDATVLDQWRARGIAITPAIPQAEAWLAEHGAVLAVVRPDRYTFGLCGEVAAASGLVDALAADLGQVA